MGLVEKLIGGSIGETVRQVAGVFKVPAEVAAAHAHELAKIQAEQEAKLQEALTHEIEAASANIRAEAQSGDKFTARARPSFIYVMLLVFLFNYIVLPLIDRAPLYYPDALFWLFGSCMLGYTGARTWEKLGLAGKGEK